MPCASYALGIGSRRATSGSVWWNAVSKQAIWNDSGRRRPSASPRAAAGSTPRSLHRSDTEIRKIAVAVVAGPQADHAAIDLPQLADVERRRLDGPHEHLDRPALHDDPQRHPVGRRDGWIDRVLELVRKFLSKTRPVVVRGGHVL